MIGKGGKRRLMNQRSCHISIRIQTFFWNDMYLE